MASLPPPYGSASSSNQQQQPAFDHPLSVVSGPEEMEMAARTPATAPATVAASTTTTFATAYGHTTAVPPPPPRLQPPIPPPPPPESPTARTLDDFVDHFLLTAASDEESSKRKLFPDALSSEHLSDFDRLLQLHSRRAYSDAANLSQQLLHGPSSHYAPVMKSLLLHNSSNHKDQTVLTLESQQQQVVQILMMHMQALLKTKQYSQLKHELDTWTFVYHHHHHHHKSHHKSHQQQLPPKSNSSPSPLWVPWAVHIAVAASLQYTNLVSASTDDDNSQENEPTSTLWALHKHIVIPPDDFKSLMYLEQTLCNIFCRNKEWKMALVCLERILETILAKFDTTTTTNNNNNNNNNQAMAKMTMMQTALTCDVLSRQGRILLQTGATQQAATLFQRAADLWKEGTTKTTTTTSITAPAVADSDLPFDTATIPCQLLVNDGLIAFAQDKYEQALECFRKATLQLKAILKQQEPNTTSTTTSTSMDLWMASGFQWTLLETPYTLYSECVNNMALCAIYTCRLQEAIHLMEMLIRDDPTAYFTERVALNLCTLYELQCDSVVAARKKRVLQLLAKRFMLQDIGPESFRLQ